MTDNLTRESPAAPRTRRRCRPFASPGSCRRSREPRATRARPKTLVFSNWPLYIDINEKTKRHPSLDLFTKRTGIKVKYIEDINDNAQFFGKIQEPLSHGTSIGRDIIVMTDNSPYPALLSRRAGSRSSTRRRSRTSRTSCPGAASGLGPEARVQPPLAVRHDRDRVQRRSRRSRSRASTQLLTDKKLKGKVTMLADFGDTVGIVALVERRQPFENRRRHVQSRDRKDQEGVKSPVRSASSPGNDYAGNAREGRHHRRSRFFRRRGPAPCGQQASSFRAPTAGGMIWTDNMLIPKGGDAHLASQSHELRTTTRRSRPMVEDYVNYICPVAGADKVLLKSDPAVAKNTLIFPTSAMLKQRASDRPHGAVQSRLQDEVAAPPWGITPGTWAFLHRYRRFAPYFLLGPGLAWLALFFVAPLGFLGHQSLQTQRPDRASPTRSPGRGTTTGRAHERTTRSSSARSSTPGSRR